MSIEQVASMVAKHEGFRKFTYTDTTGHETIGHGFNLAAGIKEEESYFLLKHKLMLLDDELRYKLAFYDALSAARKAVLVDMAYNLGIAGLFKFEKMLNALESGQYSRAAYEMTNSKWAEQVGKRSEELALIMTTGVI